MIDKKKSIERIKKLLERYSKLSEHEKNNYNEQQTKDHFIRPLFEALGWNFEDEVWPETDVSGKRVDYSFKLNGLTKFFVEAKAFSVNLDEERWAEQAINYSWHKSVPWVVLTDFEAIKIYNTEWDEPNIQSCQFIEIKFNDYLTDERLWWLSKEAFEKRVLDIEADKVGRKPKRVIDKQLADDLVRWREMLFNNLLAYNKGKIQVRKISEYVQKILDRLIFIRTLEDRRIEDIILQPFVRDWEEKGKANELLFGLNKIFRKIDKVYNSGLFEEDAYDHLGEVIDAEDHVFVEIINELYKTKGKGIRYNFADIPADIFGSIYEQYLGHIQQEESENKKSTKRKSQGIYYTPRYVVDYIVRNTLGEILKEKSSAEIANIKILDPACGSGSFLISAYQNLLDYWQKYASEKKVSGYSEKLKKTAEEFKKRKGSELSAPEKMRILRDNIYGVDLDEEAIEIARLNLLLKMVGRQAKLPRLENNICIGNSLISGDEKELKKYFGENWRDKKPFNWEKRFNEVFKQGGFDIVIGNPPWGAEIINLEKIYFKDFFESGKGIVDTFALFIEKSLFLLNNEGHLGLILPDIILLKNYPKIRKVILDSCIIKYINYTGMAFGGVNLDSVILILKKESSEIKRNENIINIMFNNKINKIKQNIFLENKDYKFNLYFDNKTLGLKEKLDETSIKLGELLEIHEGIHSGNIRNKLFLDKPISSNKCKKLIFKGSEINRYIDNWNKKYVNYDRIIVNKENKEYANLGKDEYFINNKILVRRTGDRIIATIDVNKFYASNNFFVLYNNTCLYDLKYILTILNSSVGTWYFLAIQPRKGRLFAEIKINHLNEIPIPKLNFENKK